MVTLIIAMCCGRDMDDDDVDEDEEKAQIAAESKWYRKSRSKNNISGFYPVDELLLREIRKKRKEEVAIM